MIPKAHLTSYSKMFSRQVYWSGLPCPPPGDLPNPGIKHISYVTCIGRWVLYHYRHLGMWDCGTHITFRAAQSHISSLVLVLRTHSKVRLLFSVLIMKGLTSLPMQAMKVSSHIDLEWLHALSAAVPDLLWSFSLECSVNQSCPTLCNLSVDSQAPCPWDSPGKNTGVGISSSRGSSQSKDPNPCLLHAGMQTQLQ